jgi:hypothetical protein
MAGSFGIFRQYEKVALAALAIMAMLAFFVLPPILQMGPTVGGSDPMVVSWKGGGLRESGLQRAVVMRKVMNQFLMETMRAAGQDPARMRLADDEKDVVDTILLAREAEANGIVIGNGAINQFLSEWTSDLVRPDQFEAIVAGIGGRLGVSQQDVFDALRTVLMARRMETLMLGGVGFETTPPGLRWDYFRRLEQGATIEAVPVVVEQFVADIREPSETVLREFYDRHKTELPAARSPDPGFRTPHRARYEYLVAKAGVFRDEEEKKITDEQIQKFYDERKEALYRAKPAEPAKDEAAGKESPKDAPQDSPPAESAKPQDAKPAGGAAEPATPAAGGAEKPAAEKPGPEKKEGAAVERRVIRQVAFLQPGDGDKPAAATSAAEVLKAGADAKAAEKPDAGEKPAADAKPTEPAVQFEPLDKVKDDIRERLVDEAVDRRIRAIFEGVTSDVGKYAESLALWQVAGEGAGPAPVGPDIAKIAKLQGLDGGRSDLVNASQALAAGGVGGSFDFAISREFGMRQLRWVDAIFGAGAQMLQPFSSRDVEGNRYLSWKVEDQPEFTPSFQSVRDDVLRAWRIVEARPQARKRAEELAAEAKAAGKPLADLLAGREGLEVEKVGPFTWLTRGTAPFGSAPMLTQPEGLAMPGEELMQAVFGLQSGETTVAFNEPKTVCYCIRLVAVEPGEETLKEQFLASASDPRRVAQVAEGDTRDVYDRWFEAIEARQGVDWKREPLGPEMR